LRCQGVINRKSRANKPAAYPDHPLQVVVKRSEGGIHIKVQRQFEGNIARGLVLYKRATRWASRFLIPSLRIPSLSHLAFKERIYIMTKLWASIFILIAAAQTLASPVHSPPDADSGAVTALLQARYTPCTNQGSYCGYYLEDTLGKCLAYCHISRF